MVRLGLLLLGFSACVVTPAHEQVPLANQYRTTILVEPPGAMSPGGLGLYFEVDGLAHPGDDPTELRITQGNVEVAGTTDELGAYGVAPIQVTGDSGTMPLPPTLSGAVSIAVSGHTKRVTTCDGRKACNFEDPIDGTISATIPAM